MGITQYHSKFTQYHMDITLISPNNTQYQMDISEYHLFSISAVFEVSSLV